MGELTLIMRAVLAELKLVNHNLEKMECMLTESLSGIDCYVCEIYNSGLMDINNKLDDIKGSEFESSLHDICMRLHSIEQSIGLL